MADFIVKNKIKGVLGPKAKKPLMEINFLGTGGAFNPEEGNSCVLLRTQFGDVLIDCGSTTYADLKKRIFLPNVKYVFITHFHEDHIGSLSTLLFDRYTIDEEVVNIECIKGVAKPVKTYLNLFKTSGDYVNIDEAYNLNTGNGGLYQDLNMNIYNVSRNHLRQMRSNRTGELSKMRSA